VTPPLPRERGEIAWGLLILAAGLGTRLAFVHLFPTQPVSDFQSLVAFGLWMRDNSWTTGAWYWEFFSSGLPTALSLLLRVVPGPPADVCRTATAVVCGLTPLLPFLLWRGALPLWVRTVAGAALALWPGQIAFSGVVAQDNWVLPPTVALGALAARSLIARDGGRPVAAGLLYAAGVAVRQEMLVALLPLLVAAAGLTVPDGPRGRRLALCALAAGLPLLGLGAQRGLATGRYALTSEHAGLSMLGSYIPGAVADSWTDPAPWVASEAPELLRERSVVRRAAAGLALREALRRPGFHAARIASGVLRQGLEGELASLYWSVSPPVLPAAYHERAALLGSRGARLFLLLEMAAVQALFLAALLLGALRRQPALLALGAAVAIKVALHAVTVVQGRYFLAVTALEILAIALGLWEARRTSPSRLPAAALATGLAAVLALALLSPRLDAAVRARDRDEPRTYRFILVSPGEEGTLDCRLGPGRLTHLPEHASATLEIFTRDPAPGETATALCELRTSRPFPLVLEVLDGYEAGGLPGRVEQRVEVEGAEVFRHDLAAEPGGGWARIPLGPSPSNGPRRVRLEVRALRHDPGMGWGPAASTTFRLARLKEPA
jgi:hypothetical protein